MKEKTNRNSNVEILRIISMLLIIAHHYSYYGFKDLGIVYTFNKYLVSFIGFGGKLGTLIFVLISGYYMCDSKFSIKKLIKLIGEVWFYLTGIGLLLLFVFPTNIPIDFHTILKIFIPLLYQQNWFITDYILLMIISPLLNIIIQQINKEFYKKILFVGVLICSIIPSLFYADLNINSILWFIVLYFISGYLKKHIQLNQNSKKNFLLSFLFLIILFTLKVGNVFLGNYLHMPILINNSIYFNSLISPLTLLVGLELLIAFLKLKPFSNKIVNEIASTTLGIYLIHDHFLMRNFLWGGGIFNNKIYFNSNLLIIHAMICISIVYIICAIIDLIRQKTIEKIYLKIVDKFILFYQKKNLNKFWSYVYKIIN